MCETNQKQINNYVRRVETTGRGGVGDLKYLLTIVENI